MKTLYFVRHGESESNAGNPVYQGEGSRLTEKGREQGKEIAKRCKNLRIEGFIVSTALRAKETAQIIAEEVGKEPEIEELFTERKVPRELIGKSRADEKARAMELAWIDSFFQEGVRVGSGENFSDLKSRALSALKYLEERPEESILVVTHGFFLHMMVGLVLLGESMTAQEFKKLGQSLWTDNTGLTVTEYHEEVLETVHQMKYSGWVLRVWNDHAHLG